jgi:hypothetical protein
VIDGLENDWADQLLGHHGVGSDCRICRYPYVVHSGVGAAVWPNYDLRILWDELHLRPWNAQETIDSALALVPTLPLWVIAAFVGSSMYIVGSVGYGAISAYIQLAKRADREC